MERKENNMIKKEKEKYIYEKQREGWNILLL
jgi:hypothetical protein